MGILYIVATPIGNLGDITLRAIETLKSVDIIACEDTRVSSKLLHEYGIDKPLVAVNDFNEAAKITQVISFLKDGKSVALISDAGTPLVSDPGFKIVREVILEGFKVESIPGASSVIAALTVSGMPPDKFLFVGYLPKKEEKRKQLLQSLKSYCHPELISGSGIKSTVIFFESPFRLLATLKSLQDVFGDIEICICRELTKIHEEVRREKVSQSIEHFSKIAPKGEFVLLV